MTDADLVVVDERGRRQRLDRFLAACGRWGSRSQVQRLIAAGAVEVDGEPARPSQVLRPGQRIRVAARASEEPSAVEPEDIPVDVIFEDETLLVINKPAGVVVHPGAGNWSGTLVSALVHRWRGVPRGLDPLRPGLVHRLDKDTSGVIVVVKDALSLADLARQFQRREVDKRYVAIVWGRMRERRGVLQGSIGRDPSHRKRMAVRLGGRSAITEYEVLAVGGEATYVRLHPKTGRTHQLRVHLSAMGHPIIGDAVYGGRRRGPGAGAIDRHALHAERIAFRHPRSALPVSFRAPQPADFIAARRAYFDLDTQ